MHACSRVLILLLLLLLLRRLRCLRAGGLYALSLASQLVGPMMLSRIVSGLQCWAMHGKGGVCPTSQQQYL